MSGEIVRMPRGQYRGKAIEDVPSDYLLWVAENWSEKTEEDRIVCIAADREWSFREKNGTYF